MKKYISLLLIVVLVISLSGCFNMDFKDYGKSINGNEVYEFDPSNSARICDQVSQFNLFFRDGENDYIVTKQFSDCEMTLYVKHNDEYINLSRGLTEELFTVSDILRVNWDFTIYESHALFEDVDVDYLMIRGDWSSSQIDIVDDANEIHRILENSDSFYQAFVVDFEFNISGGIIGYIDVYDFDGRVSTLEVYESGIYDVENNSFQEASNSELYSMFTALRE